MREETRQAHTMFGVVALFIFGHSLRIVLNIRELCMTLTGENPYKEKDCNRDCATVFPMRHHVRDILYKFKNNN